jgi:hypothetical protein
VDLRKVYYRPDGVKCNILQLVKLEPEWAAARIQEDEKALAFLASQQAHPADSKQVVSASCKCGMEHYSHMSAANFSVLTRRQYENL